MKAIGITPGQARSTCSVELSRPRLDEVPGGRGVLVQVLQVGVDGTDRDLYLFDSGVARSALAEATRPGWLSKLLTHPIQGLENYQALFSTLLDAQGAIKIHVIVSQE